MANAEKEPGSADLDDAGRRRLWLVRTVLERCSQQHPADALELAFRLDTFINRGVCGKAERIEEARPDRPPQDMATGEPVPEAVAAQPPTPAQERGRIPLLRSELREQFAAMAATGVDNRALAEHFRLSVRQAHAIRLSLARQRPEVRPAAQRTTPRVSPSGLTREDELRLQERFLREKPPAPCTIEDVVRFLRQRGDSVISREGRYLVDERLLLNADQLIARANRRRREVGAPEFHIDAYPSRHPAGGASGAEAG